MCNKICNTAYPRTQSIIYKSRRRPYKVKSCHTERLFSFRQVYLRLSESALLSYRRGCQADKKQILPPVCSDPLCPFPYLHNMSCIQCRLFVIHHYRCLGCYLMLLIRRCICLENIAFRSFLFHNFAHIILPFPKNLSFLLYYRTNCDIIQVK